MSNSIYRALLGSAGTGKSYTIKKWCTENPAFALKTSSTGIAAVNIGGTTVNSALGYFNTEELLYKASNGALLKTLKAIKKNYEYLIIEEVGMFPAQQLHLICWAIEQCNKLSPNERPLGVLVVGDPGQLVPVEGDGFFKCAYWPRFDVQYLTEIKRQDNPQFVEALQLARAGRAGDAADWFEKYIGFEKYIDENFNGSTFFSTNEAVDNYNTKSMAKIQLAAKAYPKILSGKNKSEWNNIPAQISLKQGCLVTLLTNNLSEGYANGDIGEVLEMFTENVLIKLNRTGKEVLIGYTTLSNTNLETNREEGTLNYLPVKVAYASTIHKAQGLTLSNVQVRVTDFFLRRLSGGLYTALSRCTSPEGLRIVGNKDAFIKACYVHPDYIPYVSEMTQLAA